MGDKVLAAEAPMERFPESRSLALSRALSRAYDDIIREVAHAVRDDGFGGITPAHVNFIGSLDCGVTQSSEVARRLGVSRQAVHKMARELTAQGVIKLVPHPERGNQKVIRFTDEGAELISKMRRHLARMDAELEARLGDGGLDALERLLAQGWVSEA